jgi:2,3-diketo-5-methylthio-1-phosphopentane phosphatase
MDSHKILFIFDLDNTILKHTTDYEVIKLIPQVEIDENYFNWAKYMQKMYLKMKENQVKLEQIKKVVESIPLNEGFSEIFEFLRKNKEKFEILIVSGANTLYIQWIIEYHKINDIVDDYFSNYAQPDEELLIKISPNHIHDCSDCIQDLSQCKKKVLEEFLSSKKIKDKENFYSSIVYVGDGSNDFCPSTMLGINDLLFPREEYQLHKMICQDIFNKKIKCAIHPWKSGGKILEVVKKNFFTEGL